MYISIWCLSCHFLCWHSSQRWQYCRPCNEAYFVFTRKCIHNSLCLPDAGLAQVYHIFIHFNLAAFPTFLVKMKFKMANSTDHPYLEYLAAKKKKRVWKERHIQLKGEWRIILQMQFLWGYDVFRYDILWWRHVSERVFKSHTLWNLLLVFIDSKPWFQDCLHVS